jgi:hypothetical protein
MIVVRYEIRIIGKDKSSIMESGSRTNTILTKVLEKGIWNTKRITN